MVESGNTYGDRVSRLVSWGHWFAFFNIVAAMLIGTRYIDSSPWPETLLGQVYLFASWFGQFGFLVFAIFILILFPLSFVMPSRKLYRFIAVILSTVGLTVLLLDTKAYQELHLHLNPIVWELALSKEQNTINADWQYLFAVIPLIFFIQLALSEWIWRKQRKLSHKHIGRPIAALFFICFIFSHLVYIWADATFYTPITNQKANFPLSYPMTAKTFLERQGWFDRQEYIKKVEQGEATSEAIVYPLEDLVINKKKSKSHNLLIISIDSLRADAIDEAYMPNAAAFAANNQWFTNHLSTSNDENALFGLYYGIPAGYSLSIKQQQIRPSFVEQLEYRNYKKGYFSTQGTDHEFFKDFVKLKDNELHSNAQDDSQTVQNFSAWLTDNSKESWMGIIRLTSVANFEEHTGIDTDVSARQQLIDAYIKATSEVDALIQQIIDEVDNSDLLSNTVVVITSDHGWEFDESKTNSWGANSNFSRYQLNVPLIVSWPEMQPQTYSHSTSHHDVSVTLMQNLLGVTSNPMDYSSGQDLFTVKERQWLMASDIKNLALITGTQTVVVDRYGNYKLYDASYQRLKNTKPKLSIIMQGLSESKRFYENGGTLEVE
jgi:membrane-anchored protein YejM (alkaline phosphatase superfamily)